MPRKTFTFEGKRYDITAATEKELIVKVAMKKRDLEEGKQKITKNMLVRDWAKEWLAAYKAPNVSDETLYAYESRIRLHIIPAIGNLQLKDVRSIHLQSILNRSAGLSRDHVKKIKYTIEQIFSSAHHNHLLISDPSSDLVMPSTRSGSRRSITEKERHYILLVAETHPAGLWIKIMLYCGLRPSETAALQGRHLDLSKKCMTIDGSLKRITNTIGSTKTASGNRVVPIPDILIPELASLRLSPYDFVFKNKDGSHLTASGMRKKWSSFKYHLNIAMGCQTYRNALVPPYPVADDLVPYCLRHTYCTDLQSAGVPINVARELMGHSDISITSKIYTHHSEISFQNAAQMINHFHSSVQPDDEISEPISHTYSHTYSHIS